MADMHTSEVLTGEVSGVTGYRDCEHAGRVAVMLPMLANWTWGYGKLGDKAFAFERWWP